MTVLSFPNLVGAADIDPAPAWGQTTPKATATVPDDMAEVARWIEGYFRRYAVLATDHHYATIALWAMHTHVHECFDVTPRLLLDSAVPGSGKTRVLELLDALCMAPMQSFSASPAAIIRSIDAAPLTLLFDEIDTIYGNPAGKEDITAAVNAGYKRGATVPRVVMHGSEAEVVHLRPFAPVALAGLVTNLPDAVRSRSIHFRLRKRHAPTEPLEKYRQARAAREAADTKVRLEQWAASPVRGTLTDADPDMPEGVEDRAAEIWEPLLAIADTLGEDWPERARAACEHFVFAPSDDTQPIGVEILEAIREVFTNRRATWLWTEHILNAFTLMGEASPWPTSRGDLTPKVLSEVLKPYEVTPRNIKRKNKDGTVTVKKGYRLQAPTGGLEPAFIRYLKDDKENTP